MPRHVFFLVYFLSMKIKGFTLIELLVVVAIIGIISTIIVPSYNRATLKGKNASIVTTMSSIDSLVDASKYPGSLETVCFDFEPGGEFAHIRTSVEEKGGIWHCDSTVADYRIYVKLHTSVTLAEGDTDSVFGKSAFAQGDESYNHNFGNYYCSNSNFESNFTHWSGENLVYPSCSDEDYTSVVQDPEPTPDPTPEPDPQPEPDPPLEDGGPACDADKTEVCHFNKTLCVSSKALKGHTKHGDTIGSC